MITRWFSFIIGMLIGGSIVQSGQPILYLCLAALGWLLGVILFALLFDRFRELVESQWPKIGLALLLALGATSAEACDRCGFRSSHCVYKRAQLVVHPDVKINYFVGAPIRIEALIAEALRNDPEYQELQKLKALKQRKWYETPENQVPHEDGWEDYVRPLGSIRPDGELVPHLLLKEKCASCHSGAKPKGGLFLDGEAPIPAGNLWAIEDRMASDDPNYRMPPRGGLTEADRCQILIESTRLSRPE